MGKELDTRNVKLDTGDKLWNVSQLTEFTVVGHDTNWSNGHEYLMCYYLTYQAGSSSKIETIYTNLDKEKFEAQWAKTYKGAVNKNFARQKERLSSFEAVYAEYLN